MASSRGLLRLLVLLVAGSLLLSASTAVAPDALHSLRDLDSRDGADRALDETRPRFHSYTRQIVRVAATGCTGALVAPRLVLTAAHCGYGNSSIPSVQFAPGEIVGVQRIHRHPKFDSATRAFDFMLLELRQASARAPIQLQLDNRNVSGRPAHLFTMALETSYRADPEVFLGPANDACAKWMGHPIDDSMICARSRIGQWLCREDGAPLVVNPGSMAPRLLAMSVTDQDCAVRPKASIYLRVSVAADFLRSTIRATTPLSTTAAPNAAAPTTVAPTTAAPTVEPLTRPPRDEPFGPFGPR